MNEDNGEERASLLSLQERALVNLRLANADRRGLSLAELGADKNSDLANALAANPKVEIRRAGPDAGKLFYKARYDAHNRIELARAIALFGDANPMRFSELTELYPDARRDLDDMTRRGEIIRVNSTDRALLDDAVFARDVFAARPSSSSSLLSSPSSLHMAGKSSASSSNGRSESSTSAQLHFLETHPSALKVRLSGTLSVVSGSHTVKTNADLSSEIFRNDVIAIEGRLFRVSSEVEGLRFRGGGVRGGAYLGGGGMSSGEEEERTTTLEKMSPKREGEKLGSEMVSSSIPTILNAGTSSSGMISGGGVVAGGGGGGGGGEASLIDYPATGVYKASSGNFVVTTGGQYSAGDTAPHRLASHRKYAKPFTSNTLPLDRPYDGPTVNNVVAYRIGASGDIRALWREVVMHGRMLAAAAEAASASAHTSGDSRTVALPAGSAGGGGKIVGGGGGGGVLEASGNTAESLFLSLGGPSAFKLQKSFPVSHQELREEMSRLHLDTRMAPGTLDSALALRPDREQQELLAQQQQRKLRKTDKRALQLKTADHLDDVTRAAVQKAAEENVRKLIESQLDLADKIKNQTL